jgi:hypothetical protein
MTQEQFAVRKERAEREELSRPEPELEALHRPIVHEPYRACTSGLTQRGRFAVRVHRCDSIRGRTWPHRLAHSRVANPWREELVR